jgi:hypothetical protein
MKTWRVITMVVAGMLAVGSAREATPAAPSDGLVGPTWHTVRIDGDALFFVIKDVGIRFEDQGRFVAAVRFIDRQQTSKTGTYRVVKPGTILLTIEGLGNAKQVQFRRQGPDHLDRNRVDDGNGGLQDGDLGGALVLAATGRPWLDWGQSAWT